MLQTQERSTSESVIATLQNQWYNVITAALGLDQQSFQLVQSSVPLPNTSGGIWEYFNSVPPLSLTNIFGQGAINRLYDDWTGVITTVLPQAGVAGQWRTVMGDHLRDWDAYKKDAKPSDVAAAFALWADLNLDPDVASRAKALFAQMKNDVINRAVDAAFDDANLDRDFGPKFSKTIQDLRDALAHGKTYAVDFNSATASRDVSHTWAKAEMGGLFRFFSGGAAGSYDRISEKAESARVTVEGQFDNVVSFGAVPSGWLNSAALGIAYGTKDNRVWPAGQLPDWESTFGTSGNLQRYATELVAFDGVDLTIVSYASYDSDERTAIKGEAEIGFWPFFAAVGSGGYTHDVSFNSSNEMTVHVTGSKGNPGILGVNVRPIKNLIG